MSSFASLCLLAYKRPQQLAECLTSLYKHTKYPYELIVNLDGGDDENREYLFDLYKKGKISKLILSNGENRGVGRSFANCIGVAEGDFICKIDTDLTFKDGWLQKGVEILENNAGIGAVSFFDYSNYDPNDTRFLNHLNFTTHKTVEDFVSSIYLFRKSSLALDGWQEDDGFHQKLKTLAITREDYVINHGFGVTKSVYVSGTEDNPRKTETFNEPLIINKATS